jgi:hypothetical protein
MTLLASFVRCILCLIVYLLISGAITTIGFFLVALMIDAFLAVT